MGRRLRGAGSPAARRLEDDRPRRTMEITILSELVDRIDAVHSRTGIPKGRIIEAALEQHLAGIRLASVPERLLLALGCTPAPGKSGDGEPAPDPAGETLPIAGDLTPSDTGGLVPEGGAEEGEKRPPARPKVDHGAARAKIFGKRDRKAS